MSRGATHDEDLFSGVRPSPGAAIVGRELVIASAAVLDNTELAVAEDGHTPLNTFADGGMRSWRPFNRRSATTSLTTSHRGLKPTATFKASLREGRAEVRAPLGNGARDLSRRNAPTAEVPREIRTRVHHTTLLRTEVRAPRDVSSHPTAQTCWLSLLILLIVTLVQGAEPNASGGTPALPIWADFVETNFPFFSSVLDARKLGHGCPADNLTPRGIILNLGHECWACFDTDLLRMSVIWGGKGITPISMCQGSYHDPGAKTPDGQETLPQILGTPWLANGIYPGWQSGSEITLTDPREPGPDKREIGRGPLLSSAGRFNSVRLTQTGACLEYEVAGATVREWVRARLEKGQPVVERSFHIERLPQALSLALGRRANLAPDRLRVIFQADRFKGAAVAKYTEQEDGLLVVNVNPSTVPVGFRVAMSRSTEFIPQQANSPRSAEFIPQEAGHSPTARWPVRLSTHGILSSAQDAFVVDNIPLPLNNPWRRNIRLADLAFFKDGRAAAVTFDGDVWIISGLGGDLTEVKWKRFTSGLHEPLGLCIRNGEVFVFDRNGIWRLRDTDGNGEADVHELFSNAFTQTAETREFACGIKAALDGSFIIAKGGIQMTTLGQHNGSVLRVSADGKSSTVLGFGLREPFIGVHPKTGLVTASDQQGNYVPTTPLQIMRDHQFYGFLSKLLSKEQYPAPIADPLTWIPYPVNASGAGQVWLTDARMGPLNDALIHLGYNRPEIFAVLLNQRKPRLQAAVVSVTRNLDFAPLNGAVNPIDGQLYVTGFQIFGTTAKQISGLARLRYTGAASTLPREVTPMDQGILLRFDTALDKAKATDFSNFSAERWNYARTYAYGSPHFKPDGSKGQEAMTPSSAYLSRDGKSVFIGIPDMKPVMQMRVGWSLASRGGAVFEQSAYFTPYELAGFDASAEGFEPVTVDLTPKARLAAAEVPINSQEGRRQAELLGCAACHSPDGTSIEKVGPTWKGLFGSERRFADGSKAVANEAYIRESIREPAARVVRGFEKSDISMPSYEGLVSDAQIEALLLYIKSLR